MAVALRMVRAYVQSIPTDQLHKESLANDIQLLFGNHNDDSTNTLNTKQLLAEALRILQEKCQRTMEYVDQVSENL